MECIESRSVDDGGLMSDKDAPNIVERVEDDRSGVAKADLEDRLTVLLPPSFADCGVIFAELEEVAEDGDCSWNLWNTLDIRNVGSC